MRRALKNISILFGIALLLYGVLVVRETGSRLASVVGTGARAPFSFLASFFGKPARSEELEALRLENKRLSAALFALSKEANIVQGTGRHYYAAKVYSNYPFNNQSLVVINAGSDHGIKALAPVTIGESILYGQVIQVSSKQSIVRTILDPDWKLPVKIGGEGADALLIGGRIPALSLINGGEVKDGDEIYSTGKDFPYGIGVGTLKGLKESTDRAFKEGEVELPFQGREVIDVFVEKDI